MACVKDADVAELISRKLEEIRSKLLVQAMGEMMEKGMELHQAHRAFGRAVFDTCAKKCKEDEAMFERIDAYKREMEQKRALLKEKKNELPETLAEVEEKGFLKETLMQKIERLQAEQAKSRAAILSQNQANKDRLKSLNKVKQVFQDQLKLEIRKIYGEKLQFIFRNINHADPECAFILRIHEKGSYQIESCEPPLECMSRLEKRLQETNNFSAFLANVRKEFKALIQK
ncbi:kinetochore protein Spc25 [Denticeps clupeoides]|uniref:Kinetochore protein SPC25 n=1 Tax=Denticeps clupeoides TaxID=299321 RepID=A0AAY4B3J9_9TELE|nr:kinetochore protein Spc25 [Denticeps clupeoides]